MNRTGRSDEILLGEEGQDCDREGGQQDCEFSIQQTERSYGSLTFSGLWTGKKNYV
jgi:hypothetical protein